MFRSEDSGVKPIQSNTENSDNAALKQVQREFDLPLCSCSWLMFMHFPFFFFLEAGSSP